MSNSPTIGNLSSYTDREDTFSETTPNMGNSSTSRSNSSAGVGNIHSVGGNGGHNHGPSHSHTSRNVSHSHVSGQPIHQQSPNIGPTNMNNLNPSSSSSAGVHVTPLSEVPSSEELVSPLESAPTGTVAGNATSTLNPTSPPEIANNGTNNNSLVDKDGLFLFRLTPLIDHSSSTSGLYFLPIIRKIKASTPITIGRYTEKNKAAAHAPQGSLAPVVFKLKVVSRTHALFQCNSEGQWFLKDCKSLSGTFLNHVRLLPALEELNLMPLIDGDIIQLGMDYRGGTEEVYRCVKMRCEFNRSWQRKVNQFNLEIHKKLKNLLLGGEDTSMAHTVAATIGSDELAECAICLMKIEPCQALFISPCSHAWHYKCIRPLIIKSYPQFYCPNCRTMCDLETDLDEDD